jgi:hypothetical protein
MAAVPPEIERAAGLPLLDAALLLWLQRRALQRWDGKSSSPRLTGNPVSQIRQAIGALDVERAQAASGPTRDRLKLAHPTAEETRDRARREARQRLRIAFPAQRRGSRRRCEARGRARAGRQSGLPRCEL